MVVETRTIKLTPRQHQKTTAWVGLWLLVYFNLLHKRLAEACLAYRTVSRWCTTSISEWLMSEPSKQLQWDECLVRKLCYKDSAEGWQL